jgi:hypothetical protein
MALSEALLSKTAQMRRRVMASEKKIAPECFRAAGFKIGDVE